MNMLIRYSDGRMNRATLLAAGTNCMLVAFTAGGTSVEFTRRNGKWFSDADGPVEIDFTAVAGERSWKQFCDRLAGLDARAPWDAESLLAGCFPLPAERGSRVKRLTPFAIQLYERFIRGDSVEQIAADLNIPASRIALRIRAAESYLYRHSPKVA